MAESALPYRWTYGKGNNDITAQPLYAEDDAETATAFEGAHGDMLLIHLVRSPRRLWQIDATEAFRLPVFADSMRFRTPGDALEWAARRAGRTPVEAVCRCGTPGAECD